MTDGNSFDILFSGSGENLCKNSPLDAREFARKKSRAMTDKRMPLDEAVKKYVKDGEYIAIGGFGHIRIPMGTIYEIVRQKKKNLTVSGHTAVQDIDVLMAGNCVSGVEIAYVVGFELRGLSGVQRRQFESGKIKMTDYTNGTMSYRLRAGAQGIPFIPVNTILGTDTMRHSPGKVVKCPFTGKKILLLPSLNPDILIMHAHRADKYGNCQIDGHIVKDDLQARASKKIIVTAEEIVDTEVIRDNPRNTVVPYFMVDAVIEQKWGSHPANMPYQYYFDNPFTENYLTAGRDKDLTVMEKWLDEWVYGLDNFDQYLKKLGEDRLNKLVDLEFLRGGN